MSPATPSAPLPIRHWPDPVLSQACAPVLAFDETLLALLDAMRATLLAAGGLGLAANQVGESVRVFIFDPRPAAETAHPSFIIECVNPVWTSGWPATVSVMEGCLSFPGTSEYVPRAAQGRLDFQDRTGAQHTLELTGLPAVCAQHEIDHCDGITFLSRVTPLKRRLMLRDLDKRAAAARARG